ncbi:MAG: FecR domain-containing protein [Kofleriaceae bacterium]
MTHVCDGRDLACLGCAAVARGHVLVRAAMTRDDTLDDLQRARIWNTLEDRLAEPAPAALRRWAVPVAITTSLAVAAAIVLVVATRPAKPRTLSVASGATLISPIGPHTHAALIGPAMVELVGTPGAATTVRLRRGTLLAEFDGGPDRSLRVLAPGLEVEVVGTLFAIEVRGAHACVSVAHGKVRVTTASGTHLVTDRQTACSDRRGGAQPIAPAIEDALAKHQRTVTAQVERPAKLRAEVTHTVEPAAPNNPASSVTMMPAPSDDPSTSPVAVPTDAAATTPVPPHSAPASKLSSRGPARPAIGSRAPTNVVESSPPNQLAGPSAPPASPPPAVAPPTSSPPSPPPATPPTDDELYRAAELALADRNPAAADRALDRLVTEHPGSPLVEQALYDRARLAHHKRAWGAARRHLDRLLALPAPRLAEPARYLACRIAVEARDGEAASCLAEYRKMYPHSPHQRDVLGMLVQLEHASGGCSAAAPRIRELVRAYGSSELAVAWRARCPEAK